MVRAGKTRVGNIALEMEKIRWAENSHLMG